MKPVISPQGVQVETLAEIYDRLAQGYREIYGQDIDLSQNTPDGQRIGIEARAILEAQEFGAALANSFDPDFAQGVSLQKIAKLSGTFLRPATKSQWDLIVNTTRALTLPAGYLIEDDLGQEWEVVSAVALVNGANTVTFRAKNFGSVEGLSGAEFSQITIVLGVSSIVATGGSTVGADEETDEEFRQRRAQSVALPAFSTVGGLISRLLNVPGVTDAIVYENDTSVLDTDRDILPHTIWAIVEGGDVATIAETIIRQKTGGTGLKGDIETQVLETITRPDGSSFQIPYTARFDRPELVDLFIRLTATKLTPTSVIDVEAIENQLATKTFRIGESIQAAELYDLALTRSPAYVVTDLEISLDGVTYTDGQVLPAVDEKMVIDALNIDVIEVTP